MQHYTLEEFEQFEALHMHNNGIWAGFESSTPELRAIFKLSLSEVIQYTDQLEQNMTRVLF